MSITDAAAGRLTRAPAPTFGTRRVPPAVARPRPEAVPSAAWQAIRRQWQGLLPRLHGFWRQGLQRAAGLPALVPQVSGSLPGLLLQAVKSLPAALKPRKTWSRDAAIRTLLHSNASTTFVRVLAYVSALAMMALAAAHFILSNPAVFEPGPAAPAAEWLNVAKPFPAFSLPLPELADSGYDYAMRRHIAGGGRQDILSWGSLQGDAPHMMVEIYRPANEFLRFESAALEIAARLDGVTTARIKPAEEMETKFGDMEMVEFSVKPGRQCLGFAHAYQDPRLQILGWYCVSGAEAVERDLAACALDRLTLLAAGSEPKVRTLFAHAELKRNFCGQRSHLMAPTPRLGPRGP